MLGTRHALETRLTGSQAVPCGTCKHVVSDFLVAVGIGAVRVKATMRGSNSPSLGR